MPKLIYLNGPMGGGKTTVASLLLKMWPSEVYYLKIDDLKNNFGNFDFDKKKNLQIIFGIAAATLEKCLANSIDVILDKALFVASEDIFFEIAKKHNTFIYKFMLYTSLETHIQRVKNRSNKLNLTQEKMTKIVNSYQRFSTLDKNNSDYTFIDTTHETPEKIAQDIFSLLNDNFIEIQKDKLYI